MNATVTRPATQKQFDFLKKLIAERDCSAVQDRIVQDRASAVMGSYSTRDASALIDLLLDQPFSDAAIVAGVERALEAGTMEVFSPREFSAGLYRDGDDLWKVYTSQKSGALLVKRVETDRHGEISFTYLGLAKHHVPADAVRLSVGEVGDLGKAFDHCLMCGRRLDVPESQVRGIGPVCAGRYDG